MKKIMNLLLIFTITLSGFIGIKEYQKNTEIPINDSYEKFEKYEKELNDLAQKNDIKFSSHGDCDDESCYKTISLDFFKTVQVSLDFDNTEGVEDSKISIYASKDNVNIFTLLDYDLIDRIFKIVFNESYKDKLMKISDDLSKVNSNGEGKTMYLDRKKDITVKYFLSYYYKPNTGIRTDDYYSCLLIETS